MADVSKVKLCELCKLTDRSNVLVSRYFKDFEEPDVTRVNNRIRGISPEAAEDYLKHVKRDYFFRPAIILSANLCGGVGKTTSIYNLGASLRRITNRSAPIVYVDGDSQGSFTSIVFGQPAGDGELILIDFLEGRASIDDVLTEIDNNVWFVKSNLNQFLMDKVLNKPQDIKKSMLRFYESVFNKLGNQTKIFQDHTPQLSTLFQSSICALNQMNDSILKTVLVPIRADKFAIQGADYILKEIYEITETFSLPHSLNIHCFLSSVDKRISTTTEAIKLIGSNERITKCLSNVVVRYCSEIPKSIMSTTNVYTSGKINNAAEDYLNLLDYVFSPKDK